MLHRKCHSCLLLLLEFVKKQEQLLLQMQTNLLVLLPNNKQIITVSTITLNEQKCNHIPSFYLPAPRVVLLFIIILYLTEFLSDFLVMNGAFLGQNHYGSVSCKGPNKVVHQPVDPIQT